MMTDVNSIDPESAYTIAFDDETCIYFPDYKQKDQIPMYVYSLLESIKEIKTLKQATGRR